MTTIDSDLSQPQPQQQKQQCIGKTSFVTTTDVMNTINETLHSLYDSTTTSTTTTSNTTTHSKPSSYFELHRRLPDGSIRKASILEQAAVDCHTCIQQAIQKITTFTTIQQQYEWVEQQRMYGNQYYQNKQYEMAIQIYLTCLPAILTKQQQQQEEEEEEEPDKINPSIRHEDKDDLNDSFIQQQEQEQQQQRLLLFCKIMNNLAQSTLQLQWYRKTETFCTMALDYLKEQQQLSSSFEETNNSTSTTTSSTTNTNRTPMVFLLEQILKLYYRRGKARRYRGEYQLAQQDLQLALHHITTSTTTTTVVVYGLEQRRIQNELQLISKKIKQEKHNQQQFQKSLQTILLSSSKEEISDTKQSVHKDTDQPKTTTTKTNLHSTNYGLFGNDTYVVSTKSYSTLRARIPQKHQQQHHSIKNNPLISNHHHYKKETNQENDCNNNAENQTTSTTTTMLENVFSYWDYYICMIKNGVISILVMLFSYDK